MPSAKNKALKKKKQKRYKLLAVIFSIVFIVCSTTLLMSHLLKRPEGTLISSRIDEMFIVLLAFTSTSIGSLFFAVSQPVNKY